MSSWFRLMHRWLGFPLGLLFVITFGSGYLTAVNELLSRVQVLPVSSMVESQVYIEPDISQKANAFTFFSSQYDNLQRVLMPTEERPYYELHSREEIIIHRVDERGELLVNDVFKQTKNESVFFDTVLQLHRNLLLGKDSLLGDDGILNISGVDIVAWVAMLSLLISFFGLYLWWPLRKYFRVKKVLPVMFKRSQFFYSHMHSGVITFAVIVLLSVTGSAITYRDMTKKILGIEHAEHNPIHVSIAQDVDNSLEFKDVWLAGISAAHELIPNGRLVRVQFANRKNTLSSFVFSSTGDWLGLPSSYVRIDMNFKHEILQVHELQVHEFAISKDMPIGEKIFSVIKPLHTGEGLHWGYVVFLLFMSALGFVMVLSGVLSFILKKRKRMAVSFPSFTVAYMSSLINRLVR